MTMTTIDRSEWMKRCFAGVLLMTSAAAFAAEPSETSVRYVKKVALPGNQTAIVAEGDFEARSVGSYTVRLYAPGAQADDTTIYESGVLLERNGTIEDVRLADIDADKRDEIIVIVRSAGTGGYLSAQALSFANGRIEARTKVSDLPADADPVAALDKTHHSDKLMGKGQYHNPNAGSRGG
jgi:hypothetical protein